MIRAYRGAASIVGSVAPLVLRDPGDRERWGDLREEFLSSVRDRRVLWIHNASVGELAAARPLITAIHARLPGHALVLSATSPAGRDLAQRVPEAVGAILLPADAPRFTSRTLDAVRPELFVLTETELWPVLLDDLSKRGIPAVLLSGRISERAFRRYRIARRLFAEVLDRVAFFGMQTEADASRIRELGASADRVAVTGALKLDREPDAPSVVIEGDDPVWVAGSTREGEEEICLEAHARARRALPGLRLVLAPRHLPRLSDVERLLERSGSSWKRRSELRGRWGSETSVLLVDTLGELSGLYGLGWVAFVGGTFAPIGGHNLLEPARLGIPVLFGPQTENVAETAERLERVGGGRRVADGSALGAAIVELAGDRKRRTEMGAAARRAFRRGGVTEASLEAISSFLPKP